MSNSWILVVFALLTGLQAQANPSLERIEQVIAQNPSIRSIDDLLPLLGSDLSSHYGLMYKSESMQAQLTHPQNPRVVLSNLQGTLFMGYVGCESPDGTRTDTQAYPGCERLEILFEQEPGRMSARTIVFPGRVAPTDAQPRHERDATACMQCHGQKLRPLWAYDLWPGAYGSADGIGGEHISYGSKEHALYERFVDKLWTLDSSKQIQAARPSSPARYTSLAWRQDRVLDFADPQGVLTAHSTITKPNTRLNEVAVSVNMRRLLTLLTDHREFQKFKYATAWWSRCFEMFDTTTYVEKTWVSLAIQNGYRIDELLPESKRPTTRFADTLPALEAKLKAGFKTLVDSVQEYNDLSNQSEISTEFYQIYYNRPAPMFYRLLEFMQLSLVDLTTSLKERQPLVFSSPRFGLAELADNIKAYTAAEEPALDKMSCRELKAASVAALSP